MVEYDFDKVLKIIRKAEPTLTAEGVNSGKRFEDDPIKEEEFRYALAWVGDQRITKRINMKLTSYHMKHYVEKYVEVRYGRHKYISSGAIIAALIYLGIMYKKIEGSREVFAAIKILKKEKKKSVKSAEYLYAFIEEMRRQSARTDKTPTTEA